MQESMNIQQDPRPRTEPYWFYVVSRGLLSLVGGLIGYILGTVLMRTEYLGAIYNLIYLMLAGLMAGFLLSGSLARRMTRSYANLLNAAGRIPPQAVIAAVVGVIVALIITVLLNTLLENVPGFTWYWSLLLTLILVTGFSWFTVANRQIFTVFRPPSPSTSVSSVREDASYKVVDTSSIIDGRIMDVIDAHFVEGRLLIPRFVLSELQNIADSSDTLRRVKGRRGLEILDKIIHQSSVPTQIIDDEVPNVKVVDEKLIQLCQKRGAALITTDYNLNRVATLQGVKVLNINQLANAVKAMFLPGERLSLHISKEGREAGQGLGFLQDGTMVVVEDAGDLIGETVDVVVTSHLQTNMGRMIFSKPIEK
jgi:uncharacterized protein YacL